MEHSQTSWEKYDQELYKYKLKFQDCPLVWKGSHQWNSFDLGFMGGSYKFIIQVIPFTYHINIKRERKTGRQEGVGGWISRELWGLDIKRVVAGY